MSIKKQIAIIIPSLNPDERMIHLIQEIKEVGFGRILIVNDGSSCDYNKFYTIAIEEFQCEVYKHAVNLGKGRALKNAFNYVLTHWKDCVGVVTVDSDGQHQLDDITRCAEALIKHPNGLILGCRDFSTKNIPFRSRFGNITTRKVLSLLCGIQVTDTQTGLRALSRNLMERFISVEGERFEYEMNMLVSTKDSEIEIVEIPIKTIYLENNKSSHFNPLLDSFKIYAVFLKYLISALSSFAVDISLFSLFNLVFRTLIPGYYIMVSTVIARIISSIFNFTQNKNIVFQNKENSKGVVIRYYILCIIQMYVSAEGVLRLYKFIGINETVIKIIVDLILFMISFQIQMKWVFKEKNRSSKQESSDSILALFGVVNEAKVHKEQ